MYVVAISNDVIDPEFYFVPRRHRLIGQAGGCHPSVHREVVVSEYSLDVMEQGVWSYGMDVHTQPHSHVFADLGGVIDLIPGKGNSQDGFSEVNRLEHAVRAAVRYEQFRFWVAQDRDLRQPRNEFDIRSESFISDERPVVFPYHPLRESR